MTSTEAGALRRSTWPGGPLVQTSGRRAGDPTPQATLETHLNERFSFHVKATVEHGIHWAPNGFWCPNRA